MINNTVRNFARIFIFRLKPDEYNEGFEMYIDSPMVNEAQILSICRSNAFQVPIMGTEEERKELQEYQITRKV